MEKQLWEYKHPFYPAEGDNIITFESWIDYIEYWKDFDDDLNLVYRFDFDQVENDDFDLVPVPRHPDPYYRAYTLRITRILQRKSRFATQVIKVCEKDMPEIQKYLKEKLDFFLKAWEPINNTKEG